MRRSSTLIWLVSLGLVVVGCTSATSETTVAPTTEPTTQSTTSTQPTTPVETTTTVQPTVHEDRWIGVDGTQFVDTRSGEVFVPRGVNLLLKIGSDTGDRLFLNYDPDWVDEQLDGIVSHGFNTVRFFLDLCMVCTTASDGINPGYLDRLSDLLTRMEAHGIVALPTSNDVPDPGFSERLPCCEPFGGYRNSLYLTTEGHEIAIEYWTELIEGLQARDTPLHHVLGWQLANEQFFLREVPPISLPDGEVTTADGETYDLSSDAEVTEMVVNNLRAYVTNVGDAIRATDEGALVTMGFFSAEDPDATRVANDDRWVVPAQIVAESTLDFVDLHAYPGLGGTWDAIGPAYGLDETIPDTPLLLGEYGAFELAYPNAVDGAAAMARWQAASCDLGFAGWLLWFWGANKDNEVIPVESNDAVIAKAASPLVRPDPCDVGPYVDLNLALEKPVTASNEENDEYSAARAVDGSDATWWSAAEGPPQWIEIDLEEDAQVGRVEILIGDVSPTGPQTHRVFVRSDGESGKGTLVGEVAADASKGEWLVVEFDPVSDVRVVRVETVRMDGWVILHEIRVLAE